MFDQKSLEHHIQKHIIGVLIHRQFARFRDLRPPKTDTNLFSYHLKNLVKAKWVEKSDDGYTLSLNGLAYVDRVSIEKLNIRSQPKIITMLLIQNKTGQILVQQRRKQPYINTWTLPYGKTHIDDPSIETGARREAKEKIGYTAKRLEHAGDVYIRVKTGADILSTTLAHVFQLTADDIPLRDDTRWVLPSELDTLPLAPALAEIVVACLSGRMKFFHELTVDWQPALLNGDKSGGGESQQ